MQAAEKISSTAISPDPGLTAHGRRVVSFYEQSLTGRLRPRSATPAALHLGFWDERIRNHAEALTNMNRALAKRTDLRPTDRVLDAGCGLGHSAIWLAREFGVEVVGVNLARGQIREARCIAHRQGVSDRVAFERRDFARTGFPDESFDVVWAMESICHAQDKQDFLDEARRLLGPGGRLVVADLFRSGHPFGLSEERLLGSWLSGWAVPDLATAEEFGESARRAGFTDVRIKDITANIWPSSRRLRLRALAGYPAAALLRMLQLYGDDRLASVRSGLEQYRALRRGLWFYGVFTAVKEPAGKPEIPLQALWSRTDLLDAESIAHLEDLPDPVTATTGKEVIATDTEPA
ncbi:MAG: SAM-dependent methyltransferase [Rubrobacteraceae bacterium]